MSKVIFVTGNIHKFQEMQAFIKEHHSTLELIQSDIVLQELQADTLEEIAKFKLLSVRDKLNPPYFIEDAGFFVDDVCNGFPGVYSSYVMKTIGYEGILKILGKNQKRTAHFESVIGYMDIQNQIHLYKGINQGSVVFEARGSSGFGFDPIFISQDTPEKTFAELSMEEKNEISHRRRALVKFLDGL